MIEKRARRLAVPAVPAAALTALAAWAWVAVHAVSRDEIAGAVRTFPSVAENARSTVLRMQDVLPYVWGAFPLLLLALTVLVGARRVSCVPLAVAGGSLGVFLGIGGIVLPTTGVLAALAAVFLAGTVLTVGAAALSATDAAV